MKAVPKFYNHYPSCTQVLSFRPPPGRRRWTTSTNLSIAVHALLTADGAESALILEGLDDVELQSATATELQQLKHHLSTKWQAVLSNRSTDWWKTLRVWGDLLQKQQWDPLRTRLALITTATAAPGSIPSLLRDDAARDPAEALKQLVALAATATRRSTASARKR